MLQCSNPSFSVSHSLDADTVCDNTVRTLGFKVKRMDCFLSRHGQTCPFNHSSVLVNNLLYPFPAGAEE